MIIFKLPVEINYKNNEDKKYEDEWINIPLLSYYR